jgi:hypothetical protein
MGREGKGWRRGGKVRGGEADEKKGKKRVEGKRGKEESKGIVEGEGEKGKKRQGLGEGKGREKRGRK